MAKHNAGLHTVMPTLRHNGRQGGVPARKWDNKNARGRKQV